MLVNKQLPVAIDFYSKETNAVSMGTRNFLLTYILQNIVFYDQQKKKLIQVWWVIDDRIIVFGCTIPLRLS